jgi:RNA-binding protein 48
VNDESRHVLIHGVPGIAVAAELKTLCEKYGSIEEIRLVNDYPSDKFCEVYYVRFHLLQAARHARIHLDDKSFYGGVLHVCYAPELETVEDTRSKLMTRTREVLHRLNPKKFLSSSYTGQFTEDISSLPSEPASTPTSHTDDTVVTVKTKASVPDKASVPVQTQRPTPVKRIVFHNRSGDGPSTLFKRPRTV